jgi:hypothetical protein
MRFGFGMWLVAVGGAAGSIALAASCGPTESSCEDLATCPPPDGTGGSAAGDGSAGATDGGSGTGGSSGDSSAIDAPTDGGILACGDAGIDPLVGTCVDDDHGVFVSPTGDDSRSGKKTAPFKTIAVALAQSVGLGRRVFACQGQYPDAIAVDAKLNGVSLYGGFDCTSWSYAAANRTVVKLDAPGVPLTVAGVTSFHVQDVELEAADAVAAGESSIAALVSESSDVMFTRVKMVAGKGADGAAGAAWVVNAEPGAKAQTGHDACSTDPNPGGIAAPTSCSGSVASIGAKGGSGASGPPSLAAADPGGDGSPTPAAGDAGVPTTGRGGAGEPVAGAWSCAAGIGKGQDGTEGIKGDSGEGATTHGTLGPAGWTGAKGVDGKTGQPGQGGGGGGGAKAPAACPSGPQTGASGGSGGGGGCGGKGGPGGGAGGSSIALVSFHSGLSLDGCTMRASSAGNAGDGAAGQHGGTGAAGETGGQGKASGADGCKGGDGANGGNGGPGGGGAGGNSLGIAYSVGKKPAVTGSSIQTGTSGSGGKDGNGLATGPGVGVAGEAANDLQF